MEKIRMYQGVPGWSSAELVAGSLGPVGRKGWPSSAHSGHVNVRTAPKKLPSIGRRTRCHGNGFPCWLDWASKLPRSPSRACIWGLKPASISWSPGAGAQGCLVRQRNQQLLTFGADAFQAVGPWLVSCFTSEMSFPLRERRVNAAFLSGNVHQQDGSAWALHAWICQILASGRFGLFFFWITSWDLMLERVSDLVSVTGPWRFQILLVPRLGDTLLTQYKAHLEWE